MSRRSIRTGLIGGFSEGVKKLFRENILVGASPLGEKVSIGEKTLADETISGKNQAGKYFIVPISTNLQLNPVSVYTKSQHRTYLSRTSSTIIPLCKTFLRPTYRSTPPPTDKISPAHHPFHNNTTTHTTLSPTNLTSTTDALPSPFPAPPLPPPPRFSSPRITANASPTTAAFHTPLLAPDKKISAESRRILPIEVLIPILYIEFVSRTTTAAQQCHG